MQKVFSFLSTVRLELSKVDWPSRPEVVKLTLTVIFVSGALGLYVGGLDYLFTKLLAFVVSN